MFSKDTWSHLRPDTATKETQLFFVTSICHAVQKHVSPRTAPKEI